MNTESTVSCEEETMRAGAAFLRTLPTLFVLAFAAGNGADAQTSFPAKPVEISVPFTAGGSTDLGARVFAEALQARWKTPVKVINQPGGNTVPAVTNLMASNPNGYSVLMDGPGSSSMLEVTASPLPFKVDDRTYLGLAAQTPLMLVVSYDSPFASLADAVSAAKANPATFTWTSGAGTTDLMFRRLFQLIKLDYRLTRAIQVRGGSDAINMAAGGHVMIGVGFWGSIAPLVSAKKLRVLAVAGPKRHPSIPDVPTTAETGYPDLIILQWIGFSGPPKMDKATIDAWRDAIVAVSNEPRVVEGLSHVGLIPFPSTPDGMRTYVTKERSIVQELWAQ
jgi:tripartite-type tricarboxylate transporter receptor subunit TctC